MQVTQKASYVHLLIDETETYSFEQSLSKDLDAFKKEHIILEVSESINISEKEILLFLDIAGQKKENGTSFVVVYSRIDIDTVPEELNMVPTVLEAEDTLEMEAIERDLGF